MKKIEILEPWFFLFFGLSHLHRIWGLIDRNSYADFWHELLLRMFDVSASFWNLLWGFHSAWSFCVLSWHYTVKKEM